MGSGAHRIDNSFKPLVVTGASSSTTPFPAVLAQYIHVDDANPRSAEAAVSIGASLRNRNRSNRAKSRLRKVPALLTLISGLNSDKNGKKMNEQSIEQHAGKAKLYVDRVRELLTQVRGWCEERQLNIWSDSTELNEELMPKYSAPKLAISTNDGLTIARIVPMGAAIIGAQGRVDLIGQFSRHAFLYHVGMGPTVAVTVGTMRAGDPLRKPILSGVDGDGWYWIEASVRRAKQVEEELFIELLTDVSDYEFR